MKNKVSISILPFRRVASLAAVALALVASSGVGATPLPTLPGYTDLQQNVANAIDFVCPRLGPAGIKPDQ